MQITTYRSIVIVFMLVCVCAYTGRAQGITGSAHDFSDDAWNPTGEVCVLCHGSHGTIAAGPNRPLWNHELSVGPWTTYDATGSGTTLAGTPVGNPTGISILCLSCHDNTVSVNNFGGTDGGTNMAVINAVANVGTDLSNDHPIAMIYDLSHVGIGGLKDPASITANGDALADWLEGGTTVQCHSCHDVHNEYNIGKLLRVSNAGSALCNTCHDK